MKQNNWTKNWNYFLWVILAVTFFVGTLWATEEVSENRSLIPYSSQTPTNLAKNKMRFKLGFEFQEISGLCPWAENNYNIQKKPLIVFKDRTDKETLFEVVIDTTDIEFVTKPFSDKDYEKMQICMDAVTFSLSTLQGLINQNNKEGFKKITFKNWIETLKGFDNLPFLVEFSGLYKEREDMLSSPFSATSPWNPNFAPQATIQHSLEYAIPLYFSLFGFDSVNDLMQFTASFPRSDYFLKEFSSIYEKPNAKRFNNLVMELAQACQQKLNGLVFLHALTLVQMTPNDEDRGLLVNIRKASERYGWKKDNVLPLTNLLKQLAYFHEEGEKFLENVREALDLFGLKYEKEILPTICEALDTYRQENDKKSLKNTSDALEETKQVDAKLSLTLMSRRPFSRMAADIGKKGNYASYFEKTMSHNARFVREYSVPTLFFRTNYAEQLFDHNPPQPKDLSNSLTKFDKIFVQQNEEILRELLKKGVISTTMIPHSQHKDLFQNYFNVVIKSVDSPFKKRLTVKEKDGVFNLKKENSGVDMLSPPWFLDSDNSMGALKKDEDLDVKGYGEAVIEVREIKGVRPWFLEKCGLESTPKGHFLRIPSRIKEHAEAMFIFLYKFGNYISSSEGITEIYSLGLPFALKNY